MGDDVAISNGTDKKFSRSGSFGFPFPNSDKGLYQGSHEN